MSGIQAPAKFMGIHTVGNFAGKACLLRRILNRKGGLACAPAVFSFMLAWLFLAPPNTFGEFRDGEARMYPAGIPSADVLKKSEKVFSPLGWMSYGATSNLTATVDWFTTIFGVPSAVLRYQPPRQGEIKYAAELFGLYAPRKVDVRKYQEYETDLKGGIFWLHFMRTASINPKTRFHLYGGVCYLNYIKYFPKDVRFDENTHEHIWTPDFGVGFEHTISRKTKWTLNAYYGDSFYYYDQDPRKYVLTYGFYFAPFSAPRHPFWSNLRLEMNGYYAYIPYANFHSFLFVPIFPILTWQWGGA